MNNWQTKKLSELTSKIGSGITPRGGSDVFIDEGVLFIRSQNIKNNKVDTTDRKYIPYSVDDKMRSSRVFSGDVLYNITGASIGRSAVYTLDEPANVNQHVCIVRLKDDNPKFVQYALSSAVGARNLWGFQAGGNREGLNFQQLGSFKINIPEKPEQERIVGVLEVWDEYIEKLEQKIALKEQLKKGLMQQLLTGRRRLPGFSDAWITVSLGEVGHARTSSVDKLSVAGEQSVRLLNYMDIYRRDHISNSDTFQMVTAKNAQIITSDLKKGDVLFTPSSETPTDIGHSAVVIEDLPLTVFSYHLMRLRMKDRYLSVNFAAYCFKTRAFYNELWKRAQGATRFTLSKEALESAKITIPADLEEQDQVAGILEVVDREIETLRSTLREIKLQKKYLLKNLITGAIRTPEDLKPLDTTRLERSALLAWNR